MADLDKIANSTASVVSTRMIIIALPFLMGLIGYLASGKLDDIKEANKEIKDTQRQFWQAVGTINGNLNEIKTTVATTNANFDSHKREDNQFDDTVKAAIQDHENRLRMISQPPIRP